MQITSVRPVFFSPTGTTEAVVRAMADGFGGSVAEAVDLTRPEVREQPLRAEPGELLVIGMPVYMGRIPALVGEWLAALEADGVPVVCVVVYGNRDYEDALLELVEAVAGSGGVSVAGAACIGEHSFSVPSLPTAQGRPDADDLAQAEAFGRKVRERLDGLDGLSGAGVEVPGVHPFRKSNQLWDVDFIAVDDACVQCGLCAEVCPAGAVDPEDSRKIDVEKCITCCACIKRCPQGARSVKPGPVMEARKRLNTNCSEPRQPEWFF